MTSDLPTAAELAVRATERLRAWRVVDTAVRVAWNERLTTTAGRAFLRLGQIELNPTLMQQAPNQLDMVLTHEAAHLAAFRLFGPNIAAHGRHWRSLMRLAGYPPEVTHKIPVGQVRRARRRYVYLRVCDQCGDRQLLPAIRYGRCGGCSSRDSFLVMKAPASAAGAAALRRLTLADVRAACD
ncbi:MAG: SprT-like domain-containing protein [Aquabacterium sp.]